MSEELFGRIQRDIDCVLESLYVENDKVPSPAAGRVSIGDVMRLHFPTRWVARPLVDLQEQMEAGIATYVYNRSQKTPWPVSALPSCHTPELLQFAVFYESLERSGMRLAHCPREIYSRLHGIRGYIGGLFMDRATGRYHLFSWERTRRMHVSEVIKCSARMWTERILLELLYGIRVESMRLVVFHRRRTRWVELQTFGMHHAIRDILDTRRGCRD